jgi:hypothetical protein
METKNKNPDQADMTVLKNLSKRAQCAFGVFFLFQ